MLTFPFMRHAFVGSPPPHHCVDSDRTLFYAQSPEYPDLIRQGTRARHNQAAAEKECVQAARTLASLPRDAMHIEVGQVVWSVTQLVSRGTGYGAEQRLQSCYVCVG
jgi:hypothetical protein